jgi:hypothetical protein
MADFTALSSCSIGGSQFELGKWTLREEPELVDGMIVGRKIGLSLEGWIEGNSGSELAGRLGSTISSLRLSGQNVVISEFGVTAYSLLAAWCRDGGPHVVLAVEPGNARRKIIKAEVTGMTGVSPGEGGGGGGSGTTTRYTMEYLPDRRRKVGQRGEIRSAAAMAEYEAARTAFEAAFSTARWVVKASIETGSTDQSLSYQLTAEELSEDLPVVAGAVVHEGSRGSGQARDALGEIRQTVSYDVAFTGDADAIYSTLRLEAERIGPIIEETKDVSALRDRRLRCSFVVIRGDGNDLMGWDVEIEATQEAGGARIIDYEGVTSLVVRQPKLAHRLSIQIRATGLLRYPKIPMPAIAGEFVEEAPGRVRRRRVDNYRRETTLSWQLIATRAYGSELETQLLRALARPAVPQFYTDPELP